MNDEGQPQTAAQKNADSLSGSNVSKHGEEEEGTAEPTTSQGHTLTISSSLDPTAYCCDGNLAEGIRNEADPILLPDQNADGNGTATQNGGMNWQTDVSDATCEQSVEKHQNGTLDTAARWNSDTDQMATSFSHVVFEQSNETCHVATSDTKSVGPRHASMPKDRRGMSAINSSLTENAAPLLMRFEEEDDYGKNFAEETKGSEVDECRIEDKEESLENGTEEAEATTSLSACCNLSGDHSNMLSGGYGTDSSCPDESMNALMTNLSTSPSMSNEDCNVLLDFQAHQVGSSEDHTAGDSLKSLPSGAPNDDNSSGNDDFLQDCTWAKGDDPWLVIDLLDDYTLGSFDVDELKMVLWNAGLLSYEDQRRLSKLSRGIPDDKRAELSKRLLRILRRCPDKLLTFTKFIDLLSTLPACRTLYQKLKQLPLAASSKSEKEGSGTAWSSYIALPLVTATVREDKLFDVAVEDSTVNYLQKWHAASHYHSAKATAVVVDAGVSQFDLHPQNTIFTQDNHAAETMFPPDADDGEDAPDVGQVNCKVKVLCDKVTPPRECCNDPNGDVEVVLLTGENSEVQKWLSMHNILDDKELDKLDTGHCGYLSKRCKLPNNSQLAGSKIFCLLPKLATSERRLYFVLHLEPLTDPDELIQFLIRLSIDITPSWLVFCSYQTIQTEGFLRRHYLDANVPYSFRVAVREKIKTERHQGSLLTHLANVFTGFQCRDNPEESMLVMHLHYVFAVAEDYFYKDMVCPPDQANTYMMSVCQVRTEENMRARENSWKEAKNHTEHNMPFTRVNVSLRNQLAPSAIDGCRALFKKLLLKLIGFVPTVLLSAKAANPGASLVTSEEQPALKFVSCRPSACQPSAGFSHLTKLMDFLVSSKVNDVLASWRGKVKVVTGIGLNEKGGASFLDRIAGSALNHVMNQSPKSQSGAVGGQKLSEKEASNNSKKPSPMQERSHSFSSGGNTGAQKTANRRLHGRSLSVASGSMSAAGAGTSLKKVEAVQGSSKTKQKSESFTKKREVMISRTNSGSLSTKPLGSPARERQRESTNRHQKEHSNRQQQQNTTNLRENRTQKSAATPSPFPLSSDGNELNLPTTGRSSTGKVLLTESPEQDYMDTGDEVFARESFREASSVRDCAFEGEGSESKLWISFRPSRSMLYVLLAFQGFPDITKLNPSAQAGALLFVATALADVFVFPLDKIDRNLPTDPLRTLGDILSLYRTSHLMPSEVHGVLVPSTKPPRVTDGRTNRQADYLKKVQEMRLDEFGLGKFFSKKEEIVCPNDRLGLVRKCMARCGEYTSGLNFLTKLKSVVANATINLHENLQLQSLLDKERSPVRGGIMSTCEERCLLCKSFCSCNHFRSKVSHPHKVRHNTVQSGTYESIRWGENFEPFTLSTATPCAEVCKVAGNRHFHRIECPGLEKCKQLIRQCSGKRIHVNDNWDYVSHSTYWESVQINDPCGDDFAGDTEAEKCPAICHADCQDSYCTLNLFHGLKAPRAMNDSSPQYDGVLGNNCAHLLRGHLFPDCKRRCASSCGQCEKEDLHTACCLRYGHDAPASSPNILTAAFTINQHVCSKHYVFLCSDGSSICPICETRCARSAHELESGHWCVHGNLRRPLASKQLVRLLKGGIQKQHPPFSDVNFRTCSDICESLGEDHCHLVNTPSAKKAQYQGKAAAEATKMAQPVINDCGQAGQHRHNEQLECLPHKSFWKFSHWSDPTLRPFPHHVPPFAEPS